MDGSTIVSQTTLPAPPSSWSIVGVGDFFGDGHDDTIVWQNSNGSITFWQMQGANIITGVQVANPGAGWVVAGVGDFSNNGYSDLLLENSSTGATEIVYMQGTQVASVANIANGGNTSLMGNTALSDTVVGFGDITGYPTFAPENSSTSSRADSPAPVSFVSSGPPTVVTQDATTVVDIRSLLGS